MNLCNPIDRLGEYFKGSIVEDYFLGYLREIKTQSFIVEENYIDKDFLIDYAHYYSRAFKQISRTTQRIHFFSIDIDDVGFLSALKKGDLLFFQSLSDSYLGFTIIKPINGKDGEPIIGRTILKTYDPNPPGAQRNFIKSDYTSSLFGIPLKISSLPFQSQDMAVGACATLACWTTLHQLSNIFDIHTPSPYELTDTITNLSYVLPCRNFPSINGLTISQMKSYFISIGLETEFIDPNNIESNNYDPIRDDIIVDAIKAYQGIQLPIIAALILNGNNKDENVQDERIEDFHAVVISGFRIEGGKVVELYIHDDRIGPYSKVHPVGNFSEWRNKWVEEGSPYKKIFVDKLLIPVYPKIRLNFPRIYSVYLDAKREGEKYNITTQLFLTTIRDYKQFLLDHDFDNKEEVLIKPMPKFLWIIRHCSNEVKLFDLVYDGTAVFADRSIMDISYHDLENSISSLALED